MAIGSTNSASRRNKRVTCRVDCIFLAGRQCPLTNVAATVHEGACPSPELRLPEEMERWGGEGPYTAKGEPRCSPPAGSKDNKTFVLSGDRGGRAERSEGAVGRQGEPRGGGCRGVRAALLPFFYLFLGIQGFASCSSGRSPTNTQPLGHWTSALRSKRLPICRARPHSWGVGDVGPRDVCRAAEGGTGQGGEGGAVASPPGGPCLGQEGVQVSTPGRKCSSALDTRQLTLTRPWTRGSLTLPRRAAANQLSQELRPGPSLTNRPPSLLPLRPAPPHPSVCLPHRSGLKLFQWGMLQVTPPLKLSSGSPFHSGSKPKTWPLVMRPHRRSAPLCSVLQTLWPRRSPCRSVNSPGTSGPLHLLLPRPGAPPPQTAMGSALLCSRASASQTRDRGDTWLRAPSPTPALSLSTALTAPTRTATSRESRGRHLPCSFIHTSPESRPVPDTE